MNKLSALHQPDAPILVCEPSCATALAHDLPALLDDERLATHVGGRIEMIDAFLEKKLAESRIVFHWNQDVTSGDARNFVVHTHCHQKTMDGGHWTQKLLQRIPGSTVTDTNAGCCGMAGSFGYEKEHADLSKKIAGQRLLPFLAQSPEDSIIVSNGFSCRNQISELTTRTPMHSIQALRLFIQMPTP
ncbi:MAG: hypothetical protein HQL78_06975 [Magnetococcales bacterium]|nr:hypothetical protein [Magnetococcales bacterium]